MLWVKSSFLYTCLVLVFFSFFFDSLIPPILSPWMSLKMELGTIMFLCWFNTHRMLRLLSLLILTYLCCLVRCLIWSLVNMYVRMTSKPHPSSFYVLRTRFPIFHAYHMQIHPSLVPPSSLDLVLLPLTLSLYVRNAHAYVPKHAQKALSLLLSLHVRSNP